ncbi:Hypp9183 [Branchiostoma lanceolatum]|uniref:Hypp9183 protein n=1 Tax=Branchiostoma lanceolatum TaxID=7740 RepID=A0A8J9ZCA1_BRALA|nr:Hypp9183 [Branchiostoma lanceolatum]
MPQSRPKQNNAKGTQPTAVSCKSNTKKMGWWISSSLRGSRNSRTQPECPDSKAGTSQSQPGSSTARATNKDSVSQGHSTTSTVRKLGSQARQASRCRRYCGIASRFKGRKISWGTLSTTCNCVDGKPQSDNQDKKTGKPKPAVVNTHKPKVKGDSKQNGQMNSQQRENGETPRNKHIQKTGNTQANRQATKKSKAQGNAIINKRPPNNNGQPPNAMNSKKNRGIKTTGTSNQKRQNVKPRSKTPKNKPTKDQRINLNKGIGTKPPKDASKPTNKKVTTSITDNGNRNGKKRHPKTKSNTKLNSLVIPAKTNTKIEKNQGIAKRTTASSIAKGTGQASSDVAMLARKTSSVTGGSSRQDSGCTTAEFKVVVAKITTHSAKIYHSKPKSVELKCTTTFGLYNPEGGVIKKAIVKGNAVISLSHLNSSSVYFACFQATDGPDKKPKCTKFATKARKEEGGTNAPIIAVSATCIIFGTFGLAALIKKACFPKVKCCKTEDKEEGEEEEEEGEEEEEKETEECNRNSGFISKLYVTRARLFFNSCSSNKDEEPESSTDEESNESTDEDPTYGTLPFRHSVIQLDQVETVSNEQTCVEFEEKSIESTSTDDSVAPNFGDVDGPEE